MRGRWGQRGTDPLTPVDQLSACYVRNLWVLGESGVLVGPQDMTASLERAE